MRAALRNYREARSDRTLGAELLSVRYISEPAAQQEYTVLFPACYFGQIFEIEARHQPGTLACGIKPQLKLLQEAVSEMVQNGCKKAEVDRRYRP